MTDPQELVKAFANYSWLKVKLRHDDFSNPQVIEFLCKEDVSCYSTAIL